MTGATGRARPTGERSTSGIWALRSLVTLSIVLGVSGAVALLGDRNLLNVWRLGWALQIPLVLVPGLVISLVWQQRRKWVLFGWLVGVVVVSYVAMLPTEEYVEDRGVRRDIPALEEAWSRYQAGTLIRGEGVGLHWAADESNPVMAIVWSGFLDYEYGSVFVPEGSEPFCEHAKLAWCRCRQVEPGFYFCETD